MRSLRLLPRPRWPSKLAPTACLSTCRPVGRLGVLPQGSYRCLMSVVEQQPSHSGKPVIEASLTPASDVIWNLNEGNRRFLLKKKDFVEKGSTYNAVDSFIEDPLQAIHVSAVVCADAHSKFAVASIFDTKPGELQVMRMSGSVIGEGDGMVGSAEFLVETTLPPALVVLGQSRTAVVEFAVSMVMTEAGRDDAPCIEVDEDITRLILVNHVLLSARDAISEQPSATFKQLCDLTAQLNIWKSIESLLCSSKLIADRVASGEMELHGAYLRQRTGRVQFFGEHPSQQRLLMNSRPSDETEIRTAEHPPVPAEQALATMFVGNRRYAAGEGGQMQVHDQDLRLQLSESGQNPIAVVVGCADSRAPIEILFDMRPGDLFVLRNAGNICRSDGCSLIGSAEYAIGHLRSKLVVVTGHTQCGAVTAAIEMARQQANLDEQTGLGSIGKVLEEIMISAKEAIEIMPGASVGEQVKLATKLNILQTMKKMMTSSDLIREGARSLDLQVHGAVYDLYSGEVEWLGQHPELEQLVGADLPIHMWRTTSYTPRSTVAAARHGEATEILDVLRQGNQRFTHGKSTRFGVATDDSELTQKPLALLMGAGEVRMPLEKIFDVADGSVVVQKTLGGLHNTIGKIDTPTAAIAFGILRYRPKVLLVVAESGSLLAEAALEQIRGAKAPSPAILNVFNDLLVSALRAIGQVDNEPSLTSAGRDRKIKRLTIELNTWYTIEQLLVSKTIRQAVRDGLELHGAILHSRTGEVTFIGEHPQLEEIMKGYGEDGSSVADM